MYLLVDGCCNRIYVIYTVVLLLFFEVTSLSYISTEIIIVSAFSLLFLDLKSVYNTYISFFEALLIGLISYVQTFRIFYKFISSITYFYIYFSYYKQNKCVIWQKFLKTKFYWYFINTMI